MHSHVDLSMCSPGCMHEIMHVIFASTLCILSTCKYNSVESYMFHIASFHEHKQLQSDVLINDVMIMKW